MSNMRSARQLFVVPPSIHAHDVSVSICTRLNQSRQILKTWKQVDIHVES
jgi:hypothetical protein